MSFIGKGTSLDTGFDSMLVRLKDDSILFPLDTETRFDSILVQLKVRGRTQLPNLRLNVSIPYWFD